MFRNEFQREIWKQNYKLTSEHKIQDTWKRVATAAAEVEEDKKEWADRFYYLLQDFKFVPGGRINANIGVEGRTGTTLFNCYVHNPKDIGYEDPDSIEGIFDMAKKQALTLKSEGGYGMNFSWLRPAGTYISGIGARTPGSLKFMEMWDKSSEIITMGTTKRHGKKRKDEKTKIRKGAQMGVLNIWHPDIEEFITAKQTQGRLTKFNLSVGITKGFMKAVQENEIWELKFPDVTFEKYKKEWKGDLEEWEEKGYPVDVYKKIKARTLWDTIMLSTYNRNEPGVLFLDLANKLNTIPSVEKIQTSNPCGEILMSTGVCNLGSLNTVKYVKIDPVTRKVYFDWKLFKEAVGIAVRFLDNINDISTTPLPEYDRSLKEKRRIGLGVMGLGSAHLMLGLRYGSDESIEFVEKLFNCKASTELLTSAKLGEEKGSFELFDAKKYFSTYWWASLYISEEIKDEIKEIGEMRNSHRSANAPTGNCVRKNTKIQTKNGIKSIAEIFRENRINISKEEKNQSFIPIKTMEAKTLEGYKRITGLYINDNDNVYSIKTENNNKIEGTNEHKVLIKIDDKTAKWIQLQNLKVGDKILLEKSS